MDKNLAVFENYKIRRVYDENTETWFFSVVDIVQVIMRNLSSKLARNYWKVLKKRLKEGQSNGYKM